MPILECPGGYTSDFATEDRPPCTQSRLAHAHDDGRGPCHGQRGLAAALAQAAGLSAPDRLVDPANPAAKTKFLAMEALRGMGGLLDARGSQRFVNEVERCHVATATLHAAGPEEAVPDAAAFAADTSILLLLRERMLKSIRFISESPTQG
ncbi:hypothetical protein C8R44DRAFT_873553 [Mycena epipterygia]|nr:hypothetical protein C8R44DRAFT_873553 [Mycena epipterygia]